MKVIMPKEVESVMLSRFHYGIQEDLDSQMLTEMGNDLKFYAGYYTDRMIMKLGKEIYGKKLIKDYTEIIEFPSNWFQHLKKTIGLKYKKSLIEVKTIFDIYALFPELKGTDPVIKFNKR